MTSTIACAFGPLYGPTCSKSFYSRSAGLKELPRRLCPGRARSGGRVREFDRGRRFWRAARDPFKPCARGKRRCHEDQRMGHKAGERDPRRKSFSGIVTWIGDEWTVRTPRKVLGQLASQRVAVRRRLPAHELLAFPRGACSRPGRFFPPRPLAAFMPLRERLWRPTRADEMSRLPPGTQRHHEAAPAFRSDNCWSSGRRPGKKQAPPPTCKDEG